MSKKSSKAVEKVVGEGAYRNYSSPLLLEAAIELAEKAILQYQESLIRKIRKIAPTYTEDKSLGDAYISRNVVIEKVRE